MTEKLFYQDSHMKAFTARVRMCQPKGNEYEVFYYTQEAQRGIVELLLTAEDRTGG